MTNWEFIRQLDKESFAKWLGGYLTLYTAAIIDDIEEPTKEDVNDINEIIYRMLDEEVQTTCEHHDISRED